MDIMSNSRGHLLRKKRSYRSLKKSARTWPFGMLSSSTKMIIAPVQKNLGTTSYIKTYVKEDSSGIIIRLTLSLQVKKRSKPLKT